MFERFTDSSRRVVVLAQEETRLQMHKYIGTEHLLAGLVHAPVIFVGGDPACSYHVVTLVKLRLQEVGKSIKIELNEEGPWKR